MHPTCFLAREKGQNHDPLALRCLASCPGWARAAGTAVRARSTGETHDNGCGHTSLEVGALAAISLILAMVIAGWTGLGLSPLVAGGQIQETCGAALANLPTWKEFPWTSQETCSSG